MESKETTMLNNQIHESIIDHKKYFVKIYNKNKIKVFLNLFKKNWLSQSFPDVLYFFESIDMKHPDLSCFIESLFYENFIDKAKSVDTIIDFCNKKKINNINIENSLPSVLLNSVNNKLATNLGNPETTLNHIRFLSVSKRWAARSYKNNQVVYAKEKHVNNLIKEETLEYFGHNSMKIEEYYQELLQKYDYFKKINCNNMAKELSNYIEKVKENLNQKKYGFYRVPISKIINIVASQKTFDIVEIIPVKDLNYLKNRNCPDFIKICETFFGKNHGIFDHYAEIKFGGINTSYLIGEIDSRSYFIGAI